jgi:hypothetical protein
MFSMRNEPFFFTISRAKKIIIPIIFLVCWFHFSSGPIRLEMERICFMVQIIFCHI